jgi:hypothetical protein
LCGLNGDGRKCPTGSFCGALNKFPNMSVNPLNDGAEQDELINYAIPIFDNVAIAFVGIIQMVTLEGWSGIMYLLEDSA